MHHFGLLKYSCQKQCQTNALVWFWTKRQDIFIQYISNVELYELKKISETGLYKIPDKRRYAATVQKVRCSPVTLRT